MERKFDDHKEGIAKNEDVQYTQALDSDDQEALERAKQADKRAENGAEG
ncbi:hypothetical protein JOD45_001376 [Scopulibacillus daqui]|uniref:YfhD-like protein n=1 Tax=Scopulibacillus daqui TaxID=1469162 RepID=A0ABS2Q019_9BACL|nr:hypothetical protein [Scopulibacillus daqui]MBM7645165.1 hypothetical protein [Scopulibacillus daqui]